MVFAAKLEVLATGEVSLDLFNKAEAWQQTFSSLSSAAKAAEKLGVFDSATRRLVEHMTGSAERGYLNQRVEVKVSHLRSSGFTKQR